MRTWAHDRAGRSMGRARRDEITHEDFNAGQDCTAATRVVHESVHDGLVAALVAAARTNARTGGPREEGVFYGPLNNADLDFGCVWIDTHIPLVSDMPHGGFKHSEYGKDLSNDGFEDSTRIKHVMSNIGG